MYYIADDGSYGNAYNLTIVPHTALNSEQWREIEEASDEQRLIKVIDLLWGTGTKVYIPEQGTDTVREVIL